MAPQHPPGSSINARGNRKTPPLSQSNSEGANRPPTVRQVTSTDAASPTGPGFHSVKGIGAVERNRPGQTRAEHRVDLEVRKGAKPKPPLARPKAASHLPCRAKFHGFGARPKETARGRRTAEPRTAHPHGPPKAGAPRATTNPVARRCCPDRTAPTALDDTSAALCQLSGPLLQHCDHTDPAPWRLSFQVFEPVTSPVKSRWRRSLDGAHFLRGASNS